MRIIARPNFPRSPLFSYAIPLENRMPAQSFNFAKLTAWTSAWSRPWASYSAAVQRVGTGRRAVPNVKDHSGKDLNGADVRSQENSNLGFTLVELLVAVFITGIALTIAGVAVVSMMQAQRKAAVEITQSTNLNRALDFITDEVRMANAISTPTSSELPTASCGTIIGVLKLTIPDKNPVAYYVHNRSGCANSIWVGPATIHRREYISGSTTNTVDQILVDAVTAPANAPSCSPSIAGGNGFYACIRNNNRSADLYLYGKLTDPVGNSRGTLLVSSQASVRSF